MSPLKNTDVRGEVITMDGVKRDVSRVITGKVTDKDGNPVSFASVKIKGTNTGVSADANGAYSIKVKPNSILIISAAGFTETEVPVGQQSVINTILENDKNVSLGETVITFTVGSIRRDPDEYYGSLDKLKRVAVLLVKDETTGKAIQNANLIVQSSYADISDTALTDRKGMYKIKGIMDNEEYEIKVSAAGYEPNEFTIDESDFKDRKKVWEVLLKKQKFTEKEITKQNINSTIAGIVPGSQVRSQSVAKLGTETRVRMGAVNTINVGGEAIYVVDGTIAPKKVDINPDDIDDITVLQGPAAAELFGPDGANGAIIITTRKAKEKVLDTVAVNADYIGRRSGGMRVSYKISYLAETKAKLMTMLTDSLKVYPNPVARNNSFSVALKLREAGEYQLQFSDASGRVLLQKQFITTAKKYTETVQPQNWPAGVYHVRVFSKNKLISSTSFIFK